MTFRGFVRRTSGTLNGLIASRRSFLAACTALGRVRGAASERADIFAERRRRLAENVGRGVIALLGYSDAEGRSGFTGFRQESNFYYLTGHAESGAALLLAPRTGKASYREILFLPSDGRRRRLWSGSRRGPDEVESTGFDEVADASDLPRELRAMIKGRKPVFGLHPPSAPRAGAARSALLERLQEAAGTTDIRDIRAPLASMRSIKSEGELALLQEAVNATEAAYRAAWTAVAPGVAERAVIAECVGAAFKAGCDRLAFPPMAGAGPNAAILHYNRNRSVMQGGELLLMDAGGEYLRYAADIARTVPVGGQFDDRQRCLYDAVLGAQRAAIAAARPGLKLNGSGSGSLQAVAEQALRNLAPSGVATDLPHALGHHVGLDVHDPSPPGGRLENGMVVAIEPGLYLPDQGIGIRIEDMIEITEDGCRLMSGGLPSGADQIEKALSTARGD